MNARFKTLGKPLRLGISAASLLLVVGLVLSAALSGGSQKTAQTDLPIEVQWSPSPTPVPETTALPSQEPVVQAAVADPVQDTPAAFSETYKREMTERSSPMCSFGLWSWGIWTAMNLRSISVLLRKKP